MTRQEFMRPVIQGASLRVVPSPSIPEEILWLWVQMQKLGAVLTGKGWAKAA